jgi:hypothetical protein
MSSTQVTERKMDAKRRVTIPTTVAFKAGSKVLVIASTDSAIIAADTGVAENLAKLLHDLETRKRRMALNEWESLVAKAGISHLSSKQIDRAVARKIKRRSDRPVVREATSGR